MIIIETLPTPAEVFKSDSGTVPDDWSLVSRCGAVVGGIPEPSLLQVLRPGLVFLYPHNAWHRLAVMCRSLAPFPGNEAAHKRFLDVDVVQELETIDGELLSVRVQDYWDSPDAYADAFPGGLRGPSEFEHSAFRDSFLEGRQP